MKIVEEGQSTEFYAIKTGDVFKASNGSMYIAILPIAGINGTINAISLNIGHGGFFHPSAQVRAPKDVVLNVRF